MTRIEPGAIVAAATFVFSGAPASADTGPTIAAPFQDGTFQSVGDAELADIYGRGLASDSTMIDGRPQTRLAIILWDETKRPVAPTGGFDGIEQTRGNIVISIGAGPGGAIR